MNGPNIGNPEKSRFTRCLGVVEGNQEEDVEEGEPGNQEESDIEERLNHPNVRFLLLYKNTKSFPPPSSTSPSNTNITIILDVASNE